MPDIVRHSVVSLNNTHFEDVYFGIVKNYVCINVIDRFNKVIYIINDYIKLDSRHYLR